MSTDFEWQVDNDEGEGPWQPPARQPLPPRPPRAPRFMWLRRLPRRAWLAIAMAIIAAIGIPSGWLVLRLGQINDEQRAAVLNVARLEDQFLGEGDLDAFAALQDPLFPGWKEWQHSSLEALTAVVTSTQEYRLMWGRTALNQFDLAAPPAYGAVRLDGERAELVVTRRYRAVRLQAAQAPEFDLSTTQYYRFANGGWLRTAPPDTVYARMRRGPGIELRLLYPDVDHALLEPYASYLQDIATQACQDLGCPRGQPAMILSAIPDELVQGRTDRSRGFGALYLPAPALLGVPGNAGGADALARLYAIQLVEAIGEQAIEARDESAEPWLSWELAHLGLEAPLDATRLRDTARQAVAAGRMTVLLSQETRTEGIWLMLDFLARPGGRSPLRTLLADENAISLSYQLVQLLRERYWEWWEYLGQVAAVDARYDTAAQLAAVCDGQAMVWSAATGALRPLGTGADQLLWAPDGQRLIAHSWRSGFTVLDMALGPMNSSQDTPLAWAPDNEWIAVDSDIDVTRYLWHLGQGERIKVAYGPGLVAWSPDGLHLAYAVNEEELYLARPDASAPQLVENGNRAVWSPDSRYLAVAANNFIDSPVYVYDLQTAQLATVITQVNGVLYDLAWTPSGTVPRLAVASHAPHAEPEMAGEVQVVSPRGEVLHAWTLAGVPFDVEWSPADGRLGWALAPLHGGGGEIWLVETDGEHAKPITAARDSSYILYWRWSPAGDWLAFDNGGITVVSADQQTALRLPVGCRTPVWRP